MALILQGAVVVVLGVAFVAVVVVEVVVVGGLCATVAVVVGGWIVAAGFSILLLCFLRCSCCRIGGVILQLLHGWCYRVVCVGLAVGNAGIHWIELCQCTSATGALIATPACNALHAMPVLAALGHEAHSVTPIGAFHDRGHGEEFVDDFGVSCGLSFLTHFSGALFSVCVRIGAPGRAPARRAGATVWRRQYSPPLHRFRCRRRHRWSRQRSRPPGDGGPFERGDSGVKSGSLAVSVLDAEPRSGPGGAEVGDGACASLPLESAASSGASAL